MASRAERWARICKWLGEAPDDVRVADLAEAFNVVPSTASRWLTRWKEEGPPSELPAPVQQHIGSPTKRARGRRGAERTPAAQLDDEDRDIAVETVRNINHVVAETMRRMRRALDESPDDQIPEIDARAAQGLLSLRRTATEVQDNHPGLMALAKGEGSGEATEDDIEDIIATIKRRKTGEAEA